ncbi:MAG: ThuA domain-containing protein [Opitutaceae bacterium]|nr:ThuA domain-containing protein [Opitutaceae bacterium]
MSFVVRVRPGSRWTRIVAVTLGLAVSAAFGAAANKPLKVCLVSAAETYQSDEAFTRLGEYLTREFGMQCELVRMNEKQDGFLDGARLLEADTAVFHSRRKTLDEKNLALLRKFMASGKGFVALRSTSHGWENWPTFDLQILGAKYGAPGKSGNWGNAEKLHFNPHPIWEGTHGLDTKRDIYRITSVAPDVNVIVEGENQNGRVPVGWTREQNGRRLFYLALGYPEEIARPEFSRAIANALLWVTRRPAQAPAGR